MVLAEIVFARKYQHSFAIIVLIRGFQNKMKIAFNPWKPWRPAGLHTVTWHGLRLFDSSQPWRENWVYRHPSPGHSFYHWNYRLAGCAVGGRRRQKPADTRICPLCQRYLCHCLHRNDVYCAGYLVILDNYCVYQCLTKSYLHKSTLISKSFVNLTYIKITVITFCLFPKQLKILKTLDKFLVAKGALSNLPYTVLDRIDQNKFSSL